MSVTTVIYHASCTDGFCAAWLFSKAFPSAEFIPVHHGQAPPDVKGKEVFIVDFSFKRPVMEQLIADAKSLVVLDHHVTARDELAGLPGCTFDMTKSGGRLAWEYLSEHYSGSMPTTCPWIVDYSEDRDLWRWLMPYSQAVNAALRSYPQDFTWWDKLALRTPPEMAIEGTAILRSEQQIIDRHIKHAREITLAGHKVLAVNATVLFSEIAGELATDRPFGVCYFDRHDGKRQFSLRSRKGGVDVSEVAKLFGGGGHPAASGFELALTDGVVPKPGD